MEQFVTSMPQAATATTPGASSQAVVSATESAIETKYNIGTTDQAGAAGTPAPVMDLLNAATALVHNLTLVTHNTQDYANILGLNLDDWLVP